MTVGSLFSGYGGLDLAVEAAFGARTVWQSEIEPGPAKVLAAHWDVPNLGDVTTVDWAAVEPVDIICGGSPCQDVSSAGKRAGMRAGTRSGLWSAMCDAIEIIRPRMVVWENVRGVLSAEADSALEPCPGCMGDVEDGAVLRALGRVVGDLSDLGYDAQWTGLRAADIGAPHGRYRVFVVARDANCDEQGPFASVRRWSQPQPSGDRRDEGRTESARIVGGSDVAFGGDAATDTDSDSVWVKSITELWSSGKTQPGHVVQWGDYEPAIRRWERTLGRVAPSPTEPNTKGGQRLSPRFVEWMMGLPAGWVTDVPGVTRNEQLKALGNGVVPQQAVEALRRLVPVLGCVA